MVKTTTTLISPDGKFVPKNYRGHILEASHRLFCLDKERVMVNFGKYGCWFVRKEQVRWN